MIKYALICKNAHSFEGWFSNSSDYEVQRKSRQIPCPVCGSSKIEKAIMAPNVATSRKKDATAKKQVAMMNEIASRIRDEISTNCEDVGDNFANEARAIHYGEKSARGIYGKANHGEAQALHEEGIAAHPLPDILTPKSKKKLN